MSDRRGARGRGGDDDYADGKRGGGGDGRGSPPAAAAAGVAPLYRGGGGGARASDRRSRRRDVQGAARAWLAFRDRHAGLPRPALPPLPAVPGADVLPRERVGRADRSAAFALVFDRATLRGACACRYAFPTCCTGWAYAYRDARGAAGVCT